MAELSKTIEDQAKVLEQTQTGKTSNPFDFANDVQSKPKIYINLHCGTWTNIVVLPDINAIEDLTKAFMDSFNVPVEYINKHIEELEYENIIAIIQWFFLIYLLLNLISQSQQNWIDKLTKENEQLVEALKSYNPEVFDAVSNGDHESLILIFALQSLRIAY